MQKREILELFRTGQLTKAEALERLTQAQAQTFLERGVTLVEPRWRLEAPQDRLGRLKGEVWLFDPFAWLKSAELDSFLADSGGSLAVIRAGRTNAPLNEPRYAWDFNRDGSLAPLFEMLAKTRKTDSVHIVFVVRPDGYGAETLAADLVERDLLQQFQILQAASVVLSGGFRLTTVVTAAAEVIAPSLEALYRVAAAEYPRFAGRVAVVEDGMPAYQTWQLLENAWIGALGGVATVRLHANDREVRDFAVAEPAQPTGATIVSGFRKGGAYVVTGGLGGIGRQICEHLGRVWGARLLIVGPSDLTPEKTEVLRCIEVAGARVTYVKCDLHSVAEIESILSATWPEVSVNGVVHIAAVNEEALISQKTSESFSRVLHPKIQGVINLERATRGHRLDGFVLFSSLASFISNPGQCDYAAANAFLDAFAVWRNARADKGACHGRTVAINWPIWREGKMQLSEASERRLWETAGLRPLETAVGLATLDRLATVRSGQLIVCPGSSERFLSFLREREVRAHASATGGGGPAPPLDSANTTTVEDFLVDLIARTLGVEASAVRNAERFEDLALDSIAIQQMNRALEARFGSLPATLFFECTTVESLRQRIEILCPAAARDDPRSSNSIAARAVPSVAPVSTTDDDARIAIIGMSGRFPRADDLIEFWRNLREGRDCIQEIPTDRWDQTGFFSTDPEAGKSYGKWGGFLTDVDKFDPLLFKISPKDAELMDPQERLFLETAWATLEDAGYNSGELRRTCLREGECKVGVFVGITSGQYHYFGIEENARGNSVYPNSGSWSVANRVSYIFDLHGPSIAVDTACSASLTSVHLACESLLRGDCAAALAGGVSLNIHPSKYLMLSQNRFLSHDGRCRSFGADGDGYVPGEGVAALLLKPLAQAIADGDQIHGVIRATAVNHGGRTTGYTVPDPNSQARLIRSALRKARLDPSSISFIEAHGTGTNLGDPIEIEGLSKALGEGGSARPRRIGSLKSITGHLEAAAGVASIVKVLLQFRHRLLPPSLHAEKLNPNIDFERSGFVVQRALEPWLPDERGRRVAAVSAFGAGGSNAHVILEDFENPPERGGKAEGSCEVAVVLSARTPTALTDYARRLLAFLILPKNERGEARLSDLAFTFQVGREPLDTRFGAVVRTERELVDVLTSFVRGEKSKRFHFAVGAAKSRSAPDAAILSELERQWKRGEIASVVSSWVAGAAVPWAALQDASGFRRISLPTYSFERRRYWLPGAASHAMDGARSDLPGCTFEAKGGNGAGTSIQVRIAPSSPLVADHRVNGSGLVPGSGHIALAVAAAGMATERTVVRRVSGIYWEHPLEVRDQSAEIEVTLKSEGKIFAFTTRGGSGEAKRVYARGTLHADSSFNASDAARSDVSTWSSRMTRSFNTETIYSGFARLGLEYGRSFRRIERLHCNDTEALAEFTQTDDLAVKSGSPFAVALWLDWAFQAIAGITYLQAGADEAMVCLPFHLGSIEWTEREGRPRFAHVTKTGDTDEHGAQNFSGTVYDEDGYPLFRFRQFYARRLRASSARPLTAETMTDAIEKNPADFIYTPIWVKQTVVADSSPSLRRTSRAVVFAPDVDFGLAELIDQQRPAGSTIVVRLAKPLTSADNGTREDLCAVQRTFEAALQEAGDAATVYFLGVAPRTAVDSRTVKNYYSEVVLALFHVVKAMIESGKPLARFELITNNVYGILPDDDAYNPFAATLIGLVKCWGREYARTEVRCVDLREGDLAGSAAALAGLWRDRLSIPPLLEAAWRDGQWYHRTTRPALAPELQGATRFRRGGTYLIIGGAGGLGSVIASELAAKHAARLILVGRRPADQAIRSLLGEIEAAGGRARYYSADVTDGTRLRRVVEEVVAEHGAIHGVFHSALVLKDRALATMDEATLRAAIDPKMAGCVALWEALSGVRLDFFALFSSSISLTGAAGQANYTAGSAFADAFGHYLASVHGLPVKIINWGFWGQKGIVATDRYREEMIDKGVLPISSDEGRRACDAIMAGSLRQAIAVKLQSKQRALMIQGSEPARAKLGLALLRVSGVNLQEMDRLLAAFERLEEAGARLAADGLLRCGLGDAAPSCRGTEELMLRMKIIPEYQRLFAATLEMLSRSGYVELDGIGPVRVTAKAAILDGVAMSRLRAELTREHPDVKPHFELLATCVAAFPEVLTGKRPHMDVLFPGGSFALVAAVYDGNRISDYFNRLVAAGVRRAVGAAIAAGASEVTILETGAGTGGSTRFVLDGLGEFSAKVHYSYTDISVAFLGEASRRFGGRCAKIDFKVLNLEHDSAAQGFAAGSYDIVFGTNVLHATRSIDETLNRIRQLLKPGGEVIISELTRRSDFATLTFGLTSGWWLYEDPTVRIPHTPLLNLHLWRQALERCGYEKFEAAGVEGVDPLRQAQAVIFGTKKDCIQRNETNQAEDSPVKTVVAAEEPLTAVASAVSNGGQRRLKELLAGELTRALKIEHADFDEAEPFESYGIDSLVVIGITERLQEIFGELPKMLLFQYNTIEALAGYLENRFPELVSNRFRDTATSNAASNSETPLRSAPLAREIAPARTAPLPSASTERVERDQVETEELAIVGVSCRFADADNLDAYWQMLVSGRSALRAVPAARWNGSLPPFYRDYLERTGVKAGILNGIDKFDPLFFKVSPRDAEGMDPQQRLMLETCWAAIEDAGHTPDSLADDGSSLGKHVGVFVGTMYDNYTLLGAEAAAKGHLAEVQTGQWSVANRVSHVFNFTGPSVAIDTACSSSLTALHLACDSIRRGDCTAALIGGVNLILHPAQLMALEHGKLLSPSGISRPFSDAGDGFLNGEGIGVLVVRPLRAALRDHDSIYGTIKASMINGSGKTDAFAVPSSKAQAELYRRCWTRGGIDPRTISYIEAQAVGSPLADAVELSGLAQVFAEAAVPAHSCAIGSVKPNIGHLEAAAGMAQVIKVLLQLRHRILVPTLNVSSEAFQTKNAGSPFFVPTAAARWNVAPPVDRSVAPQRLRAGVSSFGAGGANAHVVIEEHVPDAASGRPARETSGPALIMLSARRPKELVDQAENLRAVLLAVLRRDEGVAPLVLDDLAYTLAVGRKPMRLRLAIVAGSLSDLVQKLERWGHGATDPDVFRSEGAVGTRASRSRPETDLWPAEKTREMLAAGRADDVAQAWISGAAIDWVSVYRGRECFRAHLPTYPFQREGYWLSAQTHADQNARADDVSAEEPRTLLPSRTTARPAMAEVRPVAPRAAEVNGSSARPIVEIAIEARATLKDFASQKIIEAISAILRVKPAEIDLTEHIEAYGFDSIKVAEVADWLSRTFTIDAKPTLFFDFKSIEELVTYLVERHAEAIERVRCAGGHEAIAVPSEEWRLAVVTTRLMHQPIVPAESRVLPVVNAGRPVVSSGVRDERAPGRAAQEPIAIVGMHGVFPDSPDLKTYWDNLKQARPLTRPIPEARLAWPSFRRDGDGETLTAFGHAGFIDGVENFDSLFFNISPREAERMDPQHRLFAEVVWKAVEDAGVNPRALSGTITGVFVGVGSNDYSALLNAAGLEVDGQCATGNCHSMLPNRISFLLNLRGPSEPIDTACSSSLVAVHRAARSIQSGECEMAIAGGVNLLLSADGFLAFGRSGMLASDGRCKTFDAAANGYVRGEGIGAVLLKPLSRAMAEGDDIYGVVLGSAVNHGGHSTSLTAPNTTAQAELIEAAVRQAGVDPRTITYIEAHGTGTKLGDPIESEALVRAFRRLGADRIAIPYCGIGAVKTNIGHLETAAGIAGLIKLCLAFEYGVMPGLANFQTVNPLIDLSGSPFYIAGETRPWARLTDEHGGTVPRRAGISSFGFGGVNAHLVLAEPTARAEVDEADLACPIFVLSGRDEMTLQAYAQQFADFLAAQFFDTSADERRFLVRLIRTLQIGREAMEDRLAIVADSVAAIATGLRAFLSRDLSGQTVFAARSGSDDTVEVLNQEDARDRFVADLASQRKFTAVARLWVKGLAVNWATFHPAGALRQHGLPTYPFRRVTHWVEAAAPVTKGRRQSAPTAAELADSAPPPSVVEAQPQALGTGEMGGTAFEQQLLQIFAAQLGIAPGSMSIREDFRAYGLDSIAGLRVMQEVHQRFGDDIPMTAVLEYPSIVKLAAFIEGRKGGASPAAAEAVAAPRPAVGPPVAPPDDAAQSIGGSSPNASTVQPSDKEPKEDFSRLRLRMFNDEIPGSPTLVVMHGLSGDLTWALPLIRDAIDTYTVCGIECRDPMTVFGQTVVDTVATYAEELRIRGIPAPYIVVGYGPCAAIAQQLAVVLEATEGLLARLVVVEPQAAHVASENTFTEDLGWRIAQVVDEWARASGSGAVFDSSGIDEENAEESYRRAAEWLTTSTSIAAKSEALVAPLRRGVAQCAVNLERLAALEETPMLLKTPTMIVRSEKEISPGRSHGHAMSPSAILSADEISRVEIRRAGCAIGRVACDPVGRAMISDAMAGRTAPRNADQAVRADQGTSLVRVNKVGHKPTSFWIHTMLGDISYALNLSYLLGGDYPIYGLEPKFLDGTYLHMQSVDHMATTYVDLIQTVQPEGPYVIGGYSFGSVIAYEMAQILTRRGHEVGGLIMFDGLAPGSECFSGIDYSQVGTSSFDLMSLVLICNSFGGKWQAAQQISAQDIIDLSIEARLRFVVDHLFKHGQPVGGWDAVHRLISANYHMMTNNNAILAHYLPQRCEGNWDTWLFHCTRGFVAADNLNNLPEMKMLVKDRANGWRQHCGDKLKIFDADCDHLSLLNRAQIAKIIPDVKLAIDSAHQLALVSA